MENSTLIKRFEDLSERCENRNVITSSSFLSPAEQYTLKNWKKYHPDVRILLTGGQTGCERCIAFFLPDYMNEDTFDPEEYIHAVKIQAYYGTPTHRDYLGAVLGLGIKREWLGDIRIIDNTAFCFCYTTVEKLLTDELNKVGKTNVKVYPCSLNMVPAIERSVKRKSFTVKSMRLDAVASSMFNLSRTSTANLIRSGEVCLNYEMCEHVDAIVAEGAVISIRGYGKGCISEIGGKSRKDRLFITAEIFL